MNKRQRAKGVKQVSERTKIIDIKGMIFDSPQEDKFITINKNTRWESDAEEPLRLLEVEGCRYIDITKKRLKECFKRGIK